MTMYDDPPIPGDVEQLRQRMTALERSVLSLTAEANSLRVALARERGYDPPPPVEHVGRYAGTML